MKKEMRTEKITQTCGDSNHFTSRATAFIDLLNGFYKSDKHIHSEYNRYYSEGKRMETCISGCARALHTRSHAETHAQTHQSHQTMLKTPAGF